VFDFDGIAVAHLGDLTRVPSQTEIEALGNVHVALVPVGGGGGLTPTKAVEVISMLEPGIVIPMHFNLPGTSLKLGPLSKFLKEMGVAESDPQPSLKITPSSVPEETRVVVLKRESA
jgi:L-ascorbate metabolism protein UlaG (beta-lactamase superfamily)